MTRQRKKYPVLALLALCALPSGALAQELSIHVNLPAYRLDVYHGEERIRTYPIAIGSPDYPTPMGAYEAGAIEWNPWWNPPDSPWARSEKRTPPGRSNPMGRAKIEFLPSFYIHGSSAPLERAVSHGCIRMANEDVLELARLLTSEAGAPVGGDEIDALEESPTRTRRVPLQRPVQVKIVYRLAEEIDGEVEVHDDVYDMGMSAAEEALAARRSGR
jgi:murein L,D-transpeptidase YcbB/YkuD